LHALQSMIEELLVRAHHPEKIPTLSKKMLEINRFCPFYRDNIFLDVASKQVQQVIQHHVSDEEINNSLTRLKTVLNSMVTKLQTQIASTEKAVGEKFNVLDKDNDGQLSADELKDAIVKLLRRNYTEEDAEKLVDELDENKDGKSEFCFRFRCFYCFNLFLFSCS
jgi:Ca2+-binding EF-hand superfamily protein